MNRDPSRLDSAEVNAPGHRGCALTFGCSERLDSTSRRRPKHGLRHSGSSGEVPKLDDVHVLKVVTLADYTHKRNPSLTGRLVVTDRVCEEDH